MNEPVWVGGTFISVQFIYWDALREVVSLFVESSPNFPFQLHLLLFKHADCLTLIGPPWSQIRHRFPLNHISVELSSTHSCTSLYVGFLKAPVVVVVVDCF